MTSNSNAGLGERASAIRFIKVLLFSASLVPVVVAGGVAFRLGGFPFGDFLLVTVGVFLGQVGGDYLYYCFTHLNSDSSDPHGKIFAGWKPFFADNMLAGKRVLLGAFICLSVALGIGVYFTFKVGPEVLLFAAVGGAIALFFTPLMLRGLKEPVIFIAFGPATVCGAVFVLTGELSFLAFVASLPVAFLVTLVAHLKSARFRAAPGDGGEILVELSRGLVTTLGVGAYVAVGAAAVFGWLPLTTVVFFVSLPVAIEVIRTAGRNQNQLMTYLWVVVRSLVLLMLGGGLIAAGLFWM
jgi:1,4-dihydroxy-2-naphthoate octaprenyltransferase